MAITAKKKGKRKLVQQKRFCSFCANNLDIDYKDFKKLKNFLTERGKVIPRRISGNCAAHQRTLTVAIKRARFIALLPFTVSK
ncbi:MAG: 30S ribosomal protein S18 [Candidatus Schekmanbacteria bacterium]|nr:30S ribosomal protein S18 [Candidatus Schekmanbacteria bacterium]